MSLPSNSTLPEVAARSPVRQLKNVDLPAPFGPIRPRISPCCSVTDAASTALKLPKALVTSRASRSMACSRSDGGFRRLAAPFPQPLDQGQDAAGLEARDQQDERAIDDECQPRARASEHAVGRLLQPQQDRGADQ